MFKGTKYGCISFLYLLIIICEKRLVIVTKVGYLINNTNAEDKHEGNY